MELTELRARVRALETALAQTIACAEAWYDDLTGRALSEDNAQIAHAKEILGNPTGVKRSKSQ